MLVVAAAVVFPAASQEEHGARWALLIAVSQYDAPDMANLEYAHRDAEEISRHLRSEAGGEFRDDEITELIGSEATADGIRSAFEHHLANVDPDDYVFIFLAGHGYRDSSDSDNAGATYYLPRDADLDDLEDTAISIAEINDFVARLQSKRVLLIADACRSGTLTGRDILASNQRNASSKYFRRMANTHEGKVVLAAAREYESAWEDYRWGGGHGVFTYNLLGALGKFASCANEKGTTLDAREAFDWTQTWVSVNTRGKQHPEYGGELQFGFPLAHNVGPRDEGCDAVWASAALSLEQITLDQEKLANGHQAKQAIEASGRTVTIEPIEEWFVVTRTTMARREPNSASETVTTLKQDTPIYVVGGVEGEPWYEVQLDDERRAYILRDKAEPRASDARIVPGAPLSQRVIRWTSATDSITLDPMHGQDLGSRTVAGQIYEPLVVRTEGLELAPALALSWKHLEPKIWQFELRPGVQFHDGTRFTADDVIFSVQRARESSLASRVATISSVFALGELAVRLETSTPDPLLVARLSEVPIMSKSWTESFDGSAKTSTAANGTGAFVLDYINPEMGVILRKNAAYWDPEIVPKLADGLKYVRADSGAGRVTALVWGEFDFVPDPPASELMRLQDAADINVQHVSRPATLFLGMNQASVAAPLSKKTIREALAGAIDVDALIEATGPTDALPAGMIVAPVVHGYSNELDMDRDYDVARAKQLLAEAGYPEGFSLTLRCPDYHQVYSLDICNAIAPMLADIGVEIEVLLQEPNTMLSALRAGESTDLYMMGWIASEFDSQGVLDALVHTRQGKVGFYNFTGYSNTKIDSLIELARSEINPEEREALHQEIWHEIDDEYIYVPLRHEGTSWASTNALELPISPTGVPLFKHARFE